MPGERSIYKPWLRYRYDDLSKKSADLEQELADAMMNHEKELNSDSEWALSYQNIVMMNSISYKWNHSAPAYVWNQNCRKW